MAPGNTRTVPLRLKGKELNMSNNRKVLKVMSIIYLLGGIFSIAAGALALTAASGDASGDLSVYSVVVIVMGIVEIIAAVLGIRASNNPSKIGVVWVWALICLVCAVVSLLLSEPFLGGVGTSATDVTAVVVSAVYFVFANRVKKESQERLG